MKPSTDCKSEKQVQAIIQQIRKTATDKKAEGAGTESEAAKRHFTWSFLIFFPISWGPVER